MEIRLYTFSEALEKLKNGEISKLIRAKYMEADFINKYILLYYTKKYISLSNNVVDGKAKILTQTVLDNGVQTTSYAKIESDDILAEDYIDTSDWTLIESKKDYNLKITQ